jgi:hypothetical protein
MLRIRFVHILGLLMERVAAAARQLGLEQGRKDAAELRLDVYWCQRVSPRPEG